MPPPATAESCGTSSSRCEGTASCCPADAMLTACHDAAAVESFLFWLFAPQDPCGSLQDAHWQCCQQAGHVLLETPETFTVLLLLPGVQMSCSSGDIVRSTGGPSLGGPTATGTGMQRKRSSGTWWQSCRLPSLRGSSAKPTPLPGGECLNALALLGLHCFGDSRAGRHAGCWSIHQGTLVLSGDYLRRAACTSLASYNAV